MSSCNSTFYQYEKKITHKYPNTIMSKAMEFFGQGRKNEFGIAVVIGARTTEVLLYSK